MILMILGDNHRDAELSVVLWNSYFRLFDTLDFTIRLLSRKKRLVGPHIVIYGHLEYLNVYAILITIIIHSRRNWPHKQRNRTFLLIMKQIGHSYIYIKYHFIVMYRFFLL